MITKAEYMTRPEDTNLGPIWNSMRARQRELSWPKYVMNCEMANCANPMGYGNYNTLDGIFGIGPNPQELALARASLWPYR